MILPLGLLGVALSLITLNSPTKYQLAPCTSPSDFLEGSPCASGTPRVVSPSNPSTKPNIILIVTDDQRVDSLWAMPTVSSELINKGIKFEHGFVSNPLCCPSRASILKGQYSHNTGCINNDCINQFDESNTLNVWLQNAGYRTGLFGKYLNGYDGKVHPSPPPGWSRWVAFSPSKPYAYYDVGYNVDGVNVPSPSNTGYSTDYLSTEVLNFITSTDPRPFFVYFTPFAPHAPSVTSNSPLYTCGGGNPTYDNIACSIDLMSPWRPPSYNELDVTDKPLWIRDKNLITDEVATSSDELHKNQLRTLLPLDHSIAQIVYNALSQNNKLDNTIIIFTSDNGLTWGEHRLVNYKPCPYEECLQVPFVMRIPGIPPRVDSQNFVQNIDLAPTILDLVGVPIPANANFDGISLKPILLNQNSSPRDQIFFESLSGSGFQALRKGDLIYIYYFSTKEEEFYQLDVDPYQLQNQINNPALTDEINEIKNLFLGLVSKQPSIQPLPAYYTEGQIKALIAD